MNKMSLITTFVAGAAIGSGLTYVYVKKKYEQLVQEEIQSVKEAFRIQKDSQENTKNDVSCEEFEDEVVEDTDDEEEEFLAPEEDYDEDEHIEDEYETILNEEGYLVDVHQMYEDRPYVITPDEFDELAGYEAAGMSYYADGKLADEKGTLVDINETIGQNNLNYFGEYEEDMLHVRNPKTKTDYEVFLDPRKYSEVYPGRV